jgi:thiamine-phosphate pyrophosphorylase
MNDRADLARIAELGCLHLGQEDLAVSDARRIVGPSVRIGVSTHSLAQAQEAVLDGASYIGVGPVFPSLTKSFEQHAGVALVREVARQVRLPAFAIGGIGLDNLPQVLAAGMGRVAVSAAIWQASDPQGAAAAFQSVLKSAELASAPTS